MFSLPVEERRRREKKGVFLMVRIQLRIAGRIFSLTVKPTLYIPKSNHAYNINPT